MIQTVDQEKARKAQTQILGYQPVPPSSSSSSSSKTPKYILAQLSGGRGVNEGISIALSLINLEPYTHSSYLESLGDFTNKRSDISWTSPGHHLRVSVPRTCNLLVQKHPYWGYGRRATITTLFT
ncbi:uncharacterized protein EAE98_007353 [Botrytis deweyae]|uniref:Uncharacterized protein n=1 Tax=Botrytis deweyae TaxID=2478750 RepID=A0ABQ7IHT5_9HELO|nr:uncharacterized protein EAE98_007353 [Botrytis deweyae]KAF7924302.1 hypothetical protein EAE98_007353 [Botrytis deweyae]